MRRPCALRTLEETSSDTENGRWLLVAGAGAQVTCEKVVTGADFHSKTGGTWECHVRRSDSS